MASLHRPMKMHGGVHAELDRYVNDDDWLMEQKLDGTRAMVNVSISPDGTPHYSWVSGGGNVLSHSAATQWFAHFETELAPAEEEYWLDGEIMINSGEFWVYDIVGYGDRDLTTVSFADRRKVLEALFKSFGLGGQRVNVLPQSKTAEEKRFLYQESDRLGGEGVVLKYVNGIYVDGGRTQQQLKLKFRKTVDCIVTDRNVKGGCNARLSVFQEGKLRPIGGCSMIGKPDAQPGDVVEVGYLYATEALVVYQASLHCLRPDKPAEECTIDQLRPVSKEVVR